MGNSPDILYYAITIIITKKQLVANTTFLTDVSDGIASANMSPKLTAQKWIPKSESHT